MEVTLNTNIAKLKGIGWKYQSALADRGIKTVRDLLFCFPFRYDDFSEIKEIRELQTGEKVTIEAKLESVEKKVTFRRRMSIVEALISDDTGSMKIIWFNQPYIINALRKGEVYRFSGKVDFNSGFLTLTNPSFEKTEGPSVNTGRLLPVYHEDGTITSRWLRRQIFPLLPFAKEVPETLPSFLLENYSLISLPESVKEIHFPSSTAKKEAAKRRLAFEELFLIQLYLGLMKIKWRKNAALEIKLDVDVIKKFVKSLPFQLTSAQRRAAWEIVQDLAKPYPMNRLLEGDVGSGKTVVAAIAALIAAKSGFQTVILAPTEILALQHFKTFKKMLLDFLPSSQIGVFTRSQRRTAGKKQNKTGFLKKIAKGRIKILSATHAVLQENVNFDKLALVVIDEQHRFGVAQRSHLQKKIADLSKQIPHLLSMSATPIPRTLALAVYSDLELSILNEMPSGRQKIITKIVAPANREKMYEFIRKQLQRGRQAFVICPLIEDKSEGTDMYFISDCGDNRIPVRPSLPDFVIQAGLGERGYPVATEQQEVKAVKKEQKNLAEKVFPEFKVGLLHGRMKGKEKEKIMLDFKNKKIHILVSTSVVEVGVDVPNATAMLIEGAERFGLAQLHQFRGRVGRGGHQSFCFLALTEGGAAANRRLNALVKSNDGFTLADQDLKIRGPGEFVGTRQSGLPDLTMANLSDSELIKIARGAAGLVLSKSPDLSDFPVLRTRLTIFKKQFHGE